MDVSSIINLDYLTGIQRVVLAICNELINNPQEIHIELVYTKTDDPEFYRANDINQQNFGKRSGMRKFRLDGVLPRAIFCYSLIFIPLL